MPRPAMLVAIVTVALRPACATISASCAWYLAFKHDMLDATPLEHRRELFGLLDRDGADEDRASLSLFLENVVDDGLVLLALGAENGIRLFNAVQRPVRRDGDDVEVVDLRELDRLGFRRAGHAGQLLVLAEVVLERNRRERLVLALDLDLFLRLDRLVQAVAPPPSGHQTAGELVHDDDLAVLDHVFDVQTEQRVRAESLIDVVEQRHVRRVVQPAAVGREAMLHEPLGLRHTALGQRHRLVLLVDDVVAGLFERLAVFLLDVALRDRALLELRNDAIDFVVEVRRFFGRPRNDERRARLVDQDAVHLVHDGEVVPTLHVVREIELHVVAQVVEAELVVRAVRDVAPVRNLPLGIVQIVLDDADRHAEEPIDAAHPLGVAARQVVVDSDDVHALAFEGVEIGRKRGDQRLALAGLHLRDVSLVQHHSAHELDVEVPHVEHAAARFADDGKGFGQKIVDRRRVSVIAGGGHPGAELDGLRPQLLVGERLHRGFERVDFGNDRPKPFQLTLVLSPNDLDEEGLQHARPNEARISNHFTTMAAAGRSRAVRRATASERSCTRTA